MRHTRQNRILGLAAVTTDLSVSGGASRLSCLFQMLLALAFLTCNSNAIAAADPSLELRVKAAYIYNFCTFTQWPETAFKGDSAPLVIGILGKDPLMGHLASAIAGKTVQGHPLLLKQSDELADLRSAHVVYVSEALAPDWNKILTTFNGRPVLTVGENPAFTKSGGTIAFYPDAGRIHFEVNLGTVNASGLKLDSRLLQLARITKKGKDGH